MESIKIGDKKYNVETAITELERIKGLSGREELKEDEGMLFFYNTPLTVSMWMKDTSIPLDIIFINDEYEVILVSEGIPNSLESVACDNVIFVLEVNKDSGIEVGDELEMEEPIMDVLFLDGSSLMTLFGGERIFSRKNTRVLINKAKKADLSKSDSDYKALGKFMFKCIKIQNERLPEYVELKNN